MIVINTYFKGEIYIPLANPSITKAVKGVALELEAFIEEYERDCLIKCLGFVLYNEFLAEIDMTESNGLKPTANAKWDDLLNGKTYTDVNGNNVVWAGIRQKVPNTSTTYNKSFLANYIYWYYEKNNEISRSAVGHVKPKAKNAVIMSPIARPVTAWRKFIKLVQGEKAVATPIYSRYGLGIDYFQNTETPLYKFINDMNSLVEDTYSDFEPKLWVNQNQLGI